MSKKKKYSKELKMKLIREYEESDVSMYKLAQKYDVEYSCARKWYYNYSTMGEEAITGNNANRSYSAAQKKSIVEEYLQSKSTLKTFSIKHGILAPSTLAAWIKQYNNHEELTDSRPKGRIAMVKKNSPRKTTLKERIEIVLFCIQNDNNYALTAQDYNVTYSQVYNWVKKYLQYGEDGLQDRRGKKKPEEQMTDSERLQMENRLLKEQVKKKQMEIDLLKKVREIEGR